MGLELNNGVFNELTVSELNMIDGGIDWNSIGMGASMTAGGLIGAKVGAAVGTTGGPVGTVVGTIVGGIAGGIIYSLWD